LGLAREGWPEGPRFEPAHRRVTARHHPQPRVERSNAAGGGASGGLRLGRQHLSQPLAGCSRHHRYPLERTPVLWPTRQAVERFLALRASPPKSVRCAIYTRVSTEQGWEKNFTSLDPQLDASKAYVRSQAHAGWTMLRA